MSAEQSDRWQRSGDIAWGSVTVGGVRYDVAGGPRGVLLWGEGNSGIDVPSVLLLAVWNGLCARLSRTTVVKAGASRSRSHPTSCTTAGLPARRRVDRLPVFSRGGTSDPQTIGRSSGRRGWGAQLAAK